MTVGITRDFRNEHEEDDHQVRPERVALMHAMRLLGSAHR